MNRRSNVLLSIISIFIIWLLFSLKIDNPIILPSPIVVLRQVLNLLTQKESVIIIFSSLFRLFGSLLIAFVCGLLLGLFGGLNDAFDAFLRPIITSIRTLPIASIIIIILIWFGYQKAPYVITILVILPVIYQSVVTGIQSIDGDYRDVIQIFGLKDYRLITHVYLPLIRPFLFSALIQSLGLGIKVLVMAEMLSQTRNSIGYILYLEKLNLNIDILFAWTLILIIIVSSIEYIVKKVI